MTTDRVLQKFWQDKSYERVRIAFFGDFSAGKTSLLERMLQADYLPSREVPTTAHPMCLRKGSRVVRVHYKDGLVEEVKGDDDTLTYSLANRYEAENVSFYEIFEPNFSWGKGVEIWDTPGSNSVQKAHGERASLLHQGADLVVYVLNAQKPLTDSDREQIAHVQKGKKEERPIFFLLNKIDRISEDEMTLEELVEDLSESIKNKLGLDKFYIFPVSAKLYREPKLQEFVPDERFDDFIKKLVFYRDNLLKQKKAEKEADDKRAKQEQKNRRKQDKQDKHEKEKKSHAKKSNSSIVRKIAIKSIATGRALLRWSLLAVLFGLIAFPFATWSQPQNPLVTGIWGPATNLVMARSFELPYLTKLAEKDFEQSRKAMNEHRQKQKQTLQKREQKPTKAQGSTPNSSDSHPSQAGESVADHDNPMLLFDYVANPKLRQKHRAESHPALIYQNYKQGRVSLDYLLIKSGRFLFIYAGVLLILIFVMALAGRMVQSGWFRFAQLFFWLLVLFVLAKVVLHPGYSADAELRLALYAILLLPFLFWGKGRSKQEKSNG